MAQGRDTARHILGLGQAAIGISLAGNFHDLPADHSEACVVYVAGRSEGLLPESVRVLIRWEEIAKPRLV